MNKVYIILVNYKGFEDTIECLESVLKSSYSNFQVLVIDNSPDDISATALYEWANNNQQSINTLYPQLVYPLVKKPISNLFTTEEEFLRSTAAYQQQIIVVKSTNRGFAAANNVALKYIAAFGETDSLIWVLNNDTVVNKDCMEQLAVFAVERGAHTIVGGKLMYYHNMGKMQAIAGSYNKWLGSTHHIGEGEADLGQYDSFSFVDNNYIIGASMFFSKLFLTEVGLMNEGYFLYYEELDWMLRGAKHGFNAALQPLAIIYHKEGASIRGEKKKSDFSDYYSITNSLKFTKIWYKPCVYTVTLGVAYALLKRLFNGKFGFIKKITPDILKILRANALS